MSIMDESLGVGVVGWIYHIPFLPGSVISSLQSISLLLHPPFPRSVTSSPGDEERERGTYDGSFITHDLIKYSSPPYSVSPPLAP
jgi:hypothetical protein